MFVVGSIVDGRTLPNEVRAVYAPVPVVRARAPIGIATVFVMFTKDRRDAG
jgi:hypothetical protein